MKRRDFLKKAGLAIAAAPILVRGQMAEATVPEVAPPKVIPHDPTFFPGKYMFDRPEVIAQTREWERKSGPARVFTDLDQQTKFLKRHFAEYDEWQEFDRGKWRDRNGEVTVSQSSLFSDYEPHETRIDFLGWHMYVALGAKITPAGDEIRILHTSPTGRELDWRWKPAGTSWQTHEFKEGDMVKVFDFDAPLSESNDPDYNTYPTGYRYNLLLGRDERPELGTVIAFTRAGPRYTIIEASPVAKGVCSVLLDRPLEAKVFSNKYWIVQKWERVMRAILDHSLKTVMLG